MSDLLKEKLQHIKDIVKNSPSEALDLLNNIKVAKADISNYYEVIVLTADAYYYNSQFGRALGYYEKVLKLPIKKEEDLVNIYCNLGDCYFEKDKFKKSIKYYEKAFVFKDINQRYFLGRIYSGLGLDYLNLKKFRKAKEYFEKNSELNAKFENDYEKLLYEDSIVAIAICYWKLGDEIKAEEYFQKVITMPNVFSWILSRAYSNKGHHLFEQKIWDEALKNYIKAQDITESEEEKEYLQPYIDRCRKEIERQY